MLLLLRRLKHIRFMSGEFRKYLLYALGEMVLVIIGILIALQIDNWNDDRKEEATLRSYLQTIARNMREDIAEIVVLREQRSERLMDAMRATSFLAGQGRTSFDIAEIFFFNKATTEAHDTLYFNADTSGFEALKNSGVLDRLQGRDIERLLSKYYDTVSQIEDIESRLNRLVDVLWSQYVLLWPANVENWALMNPRAVPEDRFKALQPVYKEIVDSGVARDLLLSQVGVQSLLLVYDELVRLGKEFIDMVETGSMSFDDAGYRLLSADGDPDEGIGWPDVVVDGQIAARSYFVTGSAADFAPVFDFRSVRPIDNSLHLAYPGGAEWASLFFAVGGVAEDRPSLDFSSYDKLVLEMKGDSGGEMVAVIIKDRELADTVAPESAEIRLSDRWQTYEIDLASFRKTDLSILIIPLGFNFSEEAQSFSLRSARYVNTN